jgi:serine/threonine-protein kinase
VSATLTQIGKYRIERELGRGAMGVVYKAFDPVVERAVAIKTIHLDVENAADLVARLRREAKSVGQLEHTNIVTLYDAGESNGLFYLAMQFIQGETLQDRITRQKWFTLKEVLEVFEQICAGLDYAHHRGVIHRDIKPANIMITHDGVVKLTDFGIAKVAGTGTTSTGLVVGTPSYMSPEQALGKPIDGRSDIFSLGSMLYEMMTGEKAFPGQNATTVMYKIVHEPPTPLAVLQPGLDPAVEAIVLKALAKSPEQRFQTCGELAYSLQLYISRAIHAMPKTTVASAPPPPSPPTASGAVTTFPGSAPGPSVSTAATLGPNFNASGMVSPPVASGQAPAVTAPVTGTQPVARAGLPLAWVGGGIIGTLLLVVVILLIVQMRQPSQAPGSASQAPVQTAQPAAQPGADTTQPVGELSSKKSSPPPSPEPARRTPTQSSVTQQAAAPHASRPHSAVVRRTDATAQHAASLRPSSTASEVPVPVAKQAAPPTAPVQSAAPAPSPEAETSATSAPESFSSVMLKGDMAFQEGQNQKAYAHYLKAYRMNPGSREVKQKLVMILTLLGKPEEAQKYR